MEAVLMRRTGATRTGPCDRRRVATLGAGGPAYPRALRLVGLALGWGLALPFGPSATWAGCGTFTECACATNGSTGSYAVALADFNGDGVRDAFIGNEGPDQVYFIMTNGFIPIVTNSGQWLGTGITYGVAAGLLDGDADADVFVAREDGGWLWYNNGAGMFTGTVRLATNYCTGAAIGDLNGDGHRDIVVSRGTPVFGFRSLVLTNNGTGAFTLKDQPAFQMDHTYGVALGDMDNDGDLDVFLANNGASRLFRNNGAAAFSLWWTSSRLDESHAAALADFNGDSNLDVVVANSWPGPSVVYLNRTNGVLDAYPLGADRSDAQGVAVGDWNNDARPDIATVGWGDNAIWFNLDGTNFSRSVQPFAPELSQAAAAGDLNGDGAPDLLVVRYAGTNALWLDECLADYVRLWVHSRYGPDGPVNQIASNAVGSTVTNTMIEFVERGTTQYYCSGWSLLGNSPGFGGGTNCVMVQTNDALLIWRWETNYWLNTQDEGRFGTVYPFPNWWSAGTQIAVNGAAGDYCHFVRWTGTVDAGSATTNPLLVTMDGPKALYGNFDLNYTTNTHTPQMWLAGFAWTSDFEAVALLDPDGDGAFTWQEYTSDTIPTDGDSCLRFNTIQATHEVCRLEWKGGSQATQILEWAADMFGTWTGIQTNFPPVAPTNTAVLTNLADSGYFRVRACRWDY